MKSCAPTARAAASTSASVDASRPYAMLSRIVPENRNASCGTTPSCWWNADLVVRVHRHAVGLHRARRRVVETRDELDHRRLARAGLADERDRLAGADAEVDAPQRVFDRVAIAEADVVELDVARESGHRHRVRGRRQRASAVSSSSVMRLIATRACWYESNTCDSCWIGAKNRLRYKRNAMSAPVRERTVGDEHAARAQHEADRDVGEEVDEREVDRDEALRLARARRGSRPRSRRSCPGSSPRGRTPARRAPRKDLLAGSRSPRPCVRARSRTPSTTAPGTTAVAMNSGGRMHRADRARGAG